MGCQSINQLPDYQITQLPDSGSENSGMDSVIRPGVRLQADLVVGPQDAALETPFIQGCTIPASRCCISVASTIISVAIGALLSTAPARINARPVCFMLRPNIRAVRVSGLSCISQAISQPAHRPTTLSIIANRAVATSNETGHWRISGKASAQFM